MTSAINSYKINRILFKFLFFLFKVMSKSRSRSSSPKPRPEKITEPSEEEVNKGNCMYAYIYLTLQIYSWVRKSS